MKAAGSELSQLIICVDATRAPVLTGASHAPLIGMSFMFRQLAVSHETDPLPTVTPWRTT